MKGIQHKRNLLKAMVGAIIISTVPLYAYGNIVAFLTNLIVIFPGVFIGCEIVDLIYRYKELRRK